jgi:glucokinase
VTPGVAALEDGFVWGVAPPAGSLPGLPPREVAQVGGGVAIAGAPHAWVAPGARLDVRAFVPMPADGGFLAIDGEGARAPLHSGEFDEATVLDGLRRQAGLSCAGDVLCAAGLVGLHRAICAQRRVEPARLGVAGIVDAAVTARDPECSRAAAMFCALLGDFAAAVALHLGARGGIYLGGDLLPLLGPWFARSSFRRRFEAAGPARDRLRAVPTFIWNPTGAGAPEASGLHAGCRSGGASLRESFAAYAPPRGPAGSSRAKPDSSLA